MKKLVNVFSALVLALLVGAAMSFTPAPGGDDNNGVTVEIIKNGGWILNSSCGPILRESSTEQYKDGVLHMRTTIYQLPVGCPDIPTKAYRNDIAPGYYIQYMPSGRVVSKTVNN